MFYLEQSKALLVSLAFPDSLLAQTGLDQRILRIPSSIL